MRRILIAFTAFLALALAYGIGWTAAAVNKSTFHALANITVAKHIVDSGSALTPTLRSDASIMLESAVLTLGDTRGFILSPVRRRRIDRALDEAGRLLGSIPQEELVVVPSHGPDADRKFNETHRARLTAIIDAARGRLVSPRK